MQEVQGRADALDVGVEVEGEGAGAVPFDIGAQVKGGGADHLLEAGSVRTKK